MCIELLKQLTHLYCLNIEKYKSDTFERDEYNIITINHTYVSVLCIHCITLIIINTS